MSAKTFVICRSPSHADGCRAVFGCTLLADAPYLFLPVGGAPPAGATCDRVILMPCWKGETPEQEAEAWAWYRATVEPRWGKAERFRQVIAL